MYVQPERCTSGCSYQLAGLYLQLELSFETELELIAVLIFRGEIFPTASYRGEWSLNVPFLVVGYVFSKFCAEFTFFIYINYYYENMIFLYIILN